MTDFAICIVSPVYRTGAFLPALVERLDVVLSDVAGGWSLLFVVDACPEGSAVQALAISHPAVRSLISHDRVGQHAATSAGVEAADGEVIVVMDSDLQDRPEDVLRLVDAVVPGEIVAAGRRGRYSSFGEAFSGRAFRFVRWLVSGGAIPRDAGMFVAADAATLRRVALQAPRDGHLLSRAASLGIPIRSIAIERDERPAGRGSYSSVDRLRLGVRSLKVLRSDATANGRTGDEI